jgi:cholesterol oxidase
MTAPSNDADTSTQFDRDVIVVGSGFGGSVAALRLTEKGYNVLVLEAGRRFRDEDFAETSWRVNKFLWAPELGCYGIQRIHVLPDVLIMAGAGVGGGSLVYANTLYVPPDPFFNDPQWGKITDWKSELAPYYDQASRMLGVTPNPTMTAADRLMKQVADDMGVGSTFTLTPVGVFFGDGPGKKSEDPFFGGVGPARNGCMQCGSCMTGCRHNAKNTLVKNYLGLAENAGATVWPMATVKTIRPLEGGGFSVDLKQTGGKTRKTLTARHVVVAAGAYNTQKLLHTMKANDVMPKLSDRLGYLSRSNSEALVGAVGVHDTEDFTEGVAITSSFYPEPHTHVEPVRYGKGSNLMGFLATVLTDQEGDTPRWKTWLKTAGKHPGVALRTLWVRKWSERSVIALVMQNVDNSLTVFPKKVKDGSVTLSSKQGEGDPNPTWIPAANEVARRMAEILGGNAYGTVGDLIAAPMTAHFVGGAVIGDSPERGVIDPYLRVWNYPDMYVVDGAAVTANLGVNPSLTITAQAERAFALWPNKGDADVRPAQGQAYQRVEPIAPKNPIVPEHAPAALRFTPKAV